MIKFKYPVYNKIAVIFLSPMQQVLSYLKYFFYVALRFNPLLAICILYDDIRGERKYRIYTTDVEEVYKLKIKNVDTSNAFEYMPSNYILLEKVFSEINKYPHNHTFLDMGCGKGRSLFVAAHFGFKKITGVEFVPDYCRQLQKQITEKATQFPNASFTITCIDAAQCIIPDDVQVLFFYNPFNEKVMRPVVQQITDSLFRVTRPLYVIYLNPLFKQLFLQAGFTEIYYTKRFGYLTGCILYR